MDISGVDLSASRLLAVSAGVDVLPSERGPSLGGDLVGLICPELGVAPLVDPGTGLEDEMPTRVGSPSTDDSKPVPGSMSSGVDLELALALLEIGVLPASDSGVVGGGFGSPGGGSSCSTGSGGVVEAVPSQTSPVLRSTEVDSPPSGVAAMDQYLPWSASLVVGETTDSPLLPAPLTPRQMVEGQFVPGAVVTSLTGETDVAGGHPKMPDLSREGPFDDHQDYLTSGASPRVLDGMRGCQYHMTLYDEENGGQDFSPAYGIQLHDPKNMWVRRSRFDYSDVVPSTGFTTWDMKRCLRPRSSSNMMWASSYRTFRCYSSL